MSCDVPFSFPLDSPLLLTLHITAVRYPRTPKDPLHVVLVLRLLRIVSKSQPQLRLFVRAQCKAAQGKCKLIQSANVLWANHFPC